MKLTVVGPTHPFRGGISHYTSLLVRTLRRCHHVQFLSYSRQYPAWLYPGNNDRDPSIHLLVSEEPAKRFDALNPWAWRKIVRLIREHESEIVILPWSVFYWSPFYFLFLKKLKQLTRTAAVFVCHNVIEHESSWFRSSVSRRVLGFGDRFITHSQRDKANLLSWLGEARSGQVFVNPHPLYQHLGGRFLSKAQARNELSLKSDRILLFFGFVREYKGLRYLLESLPQILRWSSIHLIIAGEVWGDRRPYLDLIRKLDLHEHVTFVHEYIPNEQVECYFAAADLVVIPYVSATQSGIVQLAFGFSKPVIVGNVGGLAEVVEHGRTGYLVAPCDPQAIASAVLDFYDSGREQPMIQNIERTKLRFSWEAMAETINKLAMELRKEVVDTIASGSRS
jgi:glycosyltransferase involved in cell wall biosynthesis